MDANIPKTTVHNRSGWDRCKVWIPQLLTDTGLMNRLFFSPTTWNPFLKRFVTEDKIWILYQNVHQKRTWFRTIDFQLSRSLNFIRRKFFYSFDGTVKNIVYYELFLQNEAINSRKYCNQFNKLKDAIAEKRPKLANRRGYYDNEKLHVALTVREKLL